MKTSSMILSISCTEQLHSTDADQPMLDVNVYVNMTVNVNVNVDVDEDEDLNVNVG